MSAGRTVGFGTRSHHDVAPENVLLPGISSEPSANPPQTFLSGARIKGLKSKSRGAAHLILEMVLGLPPMLKRFRPRPDLHGAGSLHEPGHLGLTVATGPVIGGWEWEGCRTGRHQLLVPNHVGRRQVLNTPGSRPNSRSRFQNPEHFFEASLGIG